MLATSAYGRLIKAAAADLPPEDAHAVASILAIGFGETDGVAARLCARVGLDGAALHAMMTSLFPLAAGLFEEVPVTTSRAIGTEEQSLRDILRLYAGGGGQLTAWIGAMLARRCACPNHLWQDLGLRNRGELSALMSRHFPRLKARNSQDMKWKKFLYRLICASEGFTLCTAPVCTDCDDFDQCFGDESGESMLARLRLDQERQQNG